jgi:hypothetical protein
MRAEIRKPSILKISEAAIRKENNDLASGCGWLPGSGGTSHREALHVESTAIRVPGQQPWRVIPWLTVRVAGHVIRRPCGGPAKSGAALMGQRACKLHSMFGGVCAHSSNKCSQVKAGRRPVNLALNPRCACQPDRPGSQTPALLAIIRRATVDDPDRREGQAGSHAPRQGAARRLRGPSPPAGAERRPFRSRRPRTGTAGRRPGLADRAGPGGPGCEGALTLR